MKTFLIRAALTALTLIALAIHAPSEALPSATLPDGAVWALALAALWMLYGAFLKKPVRSARLWALAAFFSGVMTLGQSFAAVGTSEWISANKLEALWFWAGRVPLYAAGMGLLTDRLCKSRTEKELRFTPWQSGGLLLLCWLPWYICLFPGTVSTDSVSQLKIVLGLSPMSNAHPICQTGILGLFRWLGLTLGGGPDLAVALYCMVQAVLMAWLLGSVVYEMEKSRAPRGLVLGAFVFYAFCPIFPVFAFCVGKDTNFAMAVLFLSLETWRVSHLPQGEKLRPVRLIAMGVASVFCVILRNPGIYLVILTLVFLLIHSLRRGTWQAPLCGLVCASVVFGTLHLAVIPSMNIAPMPESEEYSIPLQQIARVAVSASFTAEQEAALDQVIEIEKLREEYNPELSDPVKNLWRADASKEAKAAFWPAWLSVMKDHPSTCVSATFHNVYGYLYPGYVSIIKPTLIIGNHSTRTASVAGHFDYTVNPLSAKLKAFTEGLNQNALYRILVSPGLYGWITLLAAVWLTKNKKELLPAVPALFTLAGCLLSAVNGYFRYAMPLYLCAPFLLWLVSQAAQEPKKT